MDFQKKKPNYDDQVIDLDELDSIEIELKPEQLILRAALKAQECLYKDDIKQGCYQYRRLIEHIEVLAKSAKLLPQDYETRLSEYNTALQCNDSLIKSDKIADFKLSIIMERLFSQKLSTTPMKA